MKLNWKVLFSLFLVSTFGAGSFVTIQLNDNKFIKSRKKYLDTVGNAILEHGDRIKALNNSVKDLGLESEATDLISQVMEADKRLVNLPKASLLTISFISAFCTYNKNIYNEVTSLVPNGSNTTKVIINDEIRLLEKVIQITSLTVAEAQKFFDETYGRVQSFSDDESLSSIESRWRVLGKIKRARLEKNSASEETLEKADKFIEDSKAFMKGYRKIFSELKKAFEVDRRLIDRLEVDLTTAKDLMGVKDLVESESSGDQLEQSEINRLSGEIVSAVREIFDACEEAKRDGDFVLLGRMSL